MANFLDSVIAAKEELKTPPLATRVSQFIEELILNGKLDPGVRIIEEELSEALGVSRTSLREAMLALEQTGIIERGERGGRFIRTITQEELRDLYEGWSILESEIAALACAVATEEDQASLTDLVEKMESVAAMSAFHRLNLDFHMALVRPCRNAWLRSVYDGCLKQVRFAWAYAVAWSGDRETSEREHRAILAAYIEREEEQTRSLVRKHLSAGAEKLQLIGGKTAPVAGRRRDSRPADTPRIMRP